MWDVLPDSLQQSPFPESAQEKVTLSEKPTN